MAGEDWLGAIRTGIIINNDIDVEVLRYLTDADLEKIGVLLGRRRELLAAIAELGGGAAMPAPANQIDKKQPSVASRPRRGAAFAFRISRGRWRASLSHATWPPISVTAAEAASR
jgi:hypothetical protein